MNKDITKKIKEANLLGRGGGCFPTWQKWEMVKKADGKKKYVVCNASEGEPGVKKDFFILDNYPEKVIAGIKIAIDFFGAEKGYIYLNPSYFRKLEKKLKELLKDLPIELYAKDHLAGYIGGEESSAINHIEGRRVEPRLRPPFPTISGLFGCPTLINNVETFYDVSLISSGSYKNNRFYTINGDCLWTGVYEFPENWTIEKVLKETNNYPDFDFFVQVGGDASGTVLSSSQLRRPVEGAGSITVYSALKNEPINLMRQWIDFFADESCGKCTPCREGTYRLKDMLYSKEIDWKLFNEILSTLDQTAFCGLGCVVPNPFRTYINNVLKRNNKYKFKITNEQEFNCECFK